VLEEICPTAARDGLKSVSHDQISRRSACLPRRTPGALWPRVTATRAARTSDSTTHRDRRREHPRCPVSRLAGSVFAAAPIVIHGDPMYLNAAEADIHPSAAVRIVNTVSITAQLY
jgi:hypothetical protein